MSLVWLGKTTIQNKHKASAWANSEEGKAAIKAANDRAEETIAKLKQERTITCTCGESKLPCPLHEPLV